MSSKKREPIPAIDPAWYLTDSHAHIEFDDDAENKRDDKNESEDKNENILTRARNAGVTDILIPAVHAESLREILRLRSPYENLRLHIAAGIHPHEAKDHGANLPALQQLIEENREKIRAIGEIGLDYHYDFSPAEIQQDILRRQLKIAKEENLPVILHCREAEEDLKRILVEEKISNGVFHCFSGTPELARWALDHGFYLSFSGIITFPRSQDLRETARTVPLDRLLIETDSPYLAPQARRGRENEPAFVAFVAKTLAETRQDTLETIVRQTGRNARRLFGW